MNPETREWDRTARVTRKLRAKEDFPDYRYFPEPDLPEAAILPREVEEALKGLPELPQARRSRFAQAFGLDPADAALLTSRQGLADLYEASIAEGAPPGRLADLFRVDLLSFARARDLSAQAPPIPPGDLAVLLSLEARGRIGRHHTRSVLEVMMQTGDAPGEIVDRMGFRLDHDPAALRRIVESALKAHPSSVEDYRQGRRERAVAFLMGRIMAGASGKADPREASRLLREILGALGEDRAGGR